MQKETNVNGGTKLLTASVVMTLGVGGALLFRQDAPVTPRAESASGELLVRRSGAAPPATDYAAPYALAPSSFTGGGTGSMVAGSQVAGASGLASSRNGAQLTGSIDPFQNQGTLAGTERRLTADYSRPNPTQPLAAPGFPPQRYLIDPMSEAERTPMNNVTASNAAASPQLPAEYPSAGGTAAASTSTPANSALGPMTPLGDRSRSSFMNAGIGPGTPANLTGPNAIGRTVMPTLHANSGAVAQNAPPSFSPSAAPAPAEEPARTKGTKARRHRVRDGDTLASLAERYYGDTERYSAIYEANRGVLSNPDLLPIGAELLIPSADQAAAAAAATSSTPPPAARLLPRVQIRPLGE